MEGLYTTADAQEVAAPKSGLVSWLGEKEVGDRVANLLNSVKRPVQRRVQSWEKEMTTGSLRRASSTLASLFPALIFAIYLLASTQPTSAAERGTETVSDKRLPSYFPNTEALRPDEMRITALGTGLPTPTTRAQKSTAWMVELGNGDLFIFDIGSGSMENLFGLRPDFSKIDKVFLSHPHSDHFGDLDAFIVGSWLSGR